MGAFNTVAAEVTCPACGRASFVGVQFKYGDTWQHDYRIGDRLKWGGNDIGTPGHKRVVVEGLVGPCPFCELNGFDCDVVVANDAIEEVRSLPKPRSQSSPEGFVVVD